jgi:putative membrane protein
MDNENEEFIINEGIFNKQKTIIQLNRIQQVNINQSLIQRLVGVYELDVLPVALKRRANKGAFTLAIVLKARLLDNEKKESSSVP